MSGILGKKTENQKNVPASYGWYGITLRKHSCQRPLCRFLALDEEHEPFAIKRRNGDLLVDSGIM